MDDTAMKAHSGSATQPTGPEIVESFCGCPFDAEVPPEIERAMLLAGRAGHLTPEAKALCMPWVARRDLP